MSTVIDPKSIKISGKPVTPASASTDFSVFMGSMASAGGEAAVKAEGSNTAAVTHAAMTGLSQASAPYNAPYLGLANAGGTVPIASYNLSDAQWATGGTTGTGVTPTSGAPFQNASQDFVEKDFLLRQMNDNAMNMLILQARVQDQNRQFTLVSNLFQSRDRMLQNMIQNIGRT